MAKTDRPFTHHVWWRYENGGRVVSGWHDEPKKYRSFRAAMMAATDLNKYYTLPELGVFLRHVVLEVGEHPSTAFKDE